MPFDCRLEEPFLNCICVFLILGTLNMNASMNFAVNCAGKRISGLVDLVKSLVLGTFQDSFGSLLLGLVRFG